MLSDFFKTVASFISYQNGSKTMLTPSKEIVCNTPVTWNAYLFILSLLKNKGKKRKSEENKFCRNFKEYFLSHLNSSGEVALKTV